MQEAKPASQIVCDCLQLSSAVLQSFLHLAASIVDGVNEPLHADSAIVRKHNTAANLI
jgi:hypothetical protein